MSGIHDFNNGGRRADLETILHANEATKAFQKRKQSVYEGFRASLAFVRKQYRQLRSVTV